MVRRRKTMTEVTIAAAQPGDIPRVQEIEVLAGALFLNTEMAAVATDPPPEKAEVQLAIDRESCWVARCGSEARDEAQSRLVVGYLMAQLLDGDLHIGQVSVDPAYSGRRIGADLVRWAAQIGASRGASRITLTTFRDLPWNAPYYRRLGFHTISAQDTGPQLREAVASEAARGLARWPRVTMAQELPWRSEMNHSAASRSSPAPPTSSDPR